MEGRHGERGAMIQNGERGRDDGIMRMEGFFSPSFTRLQLHPLTLSPQTQYDGVAFTQMTSPVDLVAELQ